MNREDAIPLALNYQVTRYTDKTGEQWRRNISIYLKKDGK